MTRPWIVCGFTCKCGNEWITNFYSVPWFENYSRKCDRCDRLCWPDSKHDFRR